MDTTPNVSLYIAASLDGYIARADGALDWLDSLPNPDGSDHGYHAFLEGIDLIVMGRKTYEKLLSFGIPWPYPEQRTYVVTSDISLETPSPNTTLIHQIDCEVIARFRSECSRGIWLVGGGELIGSFLKLDAVDEMIISMIPLVLGGGIPLFPTGSPETWFELAGVEGFSSGAVNLRYLRRCHT
jgi:dihydrofolate reductase